MTYAAPVMSTVHPSSSPRRRVRAIVPTVLAVSLALLASVVGSSPAAATPSPCPSGQTVAPSTGSPPTSQTPSGGATTTTPVCVVAPPTPIAAPSVSPAHTVGGPKLATSGVVYQSTSSVPAPPIVSDVSYVVADMDSGQILAAKDAHAWLLPASTLKTLTSLVVLPSLDPATSVTATDVEANADGTRVGLVPGATYTVADLFYGLVLISGNDTAYALADAYGGKDKTIADMNVKARGLGAWDTVAVDPSGLDADGQHSSAYDLALFGRAVMKLAAYRTYATAGQYEFPGGTDRGGKVYAPFQIQNHNLLLANYPGTIGVKNGFTAGARQTFIGAATRGGRTLVVAQMGGTDVPSWKRSAALLDWAFANAANLTPVGTLVAPGAPQPPELGGTPVPTTAGTPDPTATPEVPAAGATLASPPSPTGAPVLAGASPEQAGGNPLPALRTSAQTAGGNPATYAVLAVLLLVAFAAVRIRRAHDRNKV